MSSADRQKIVVGIIYNIAHDKILLSRRPMGVHQGGLLEFPGGKSISGESSLQTLERELEEEIGIKVLQPYNLISYDYEYQDRKINLSAWIINRWEGTPRANEGQELKWVASSLVKSLEFPKANSRLIESIELPALYLITPDLEIYDDVFLKKITSMINCGLKILQFRSPSSKIDHHKIILDKLLPACEQYNCKLIYNGDIIEARKFGAHGVHLNSARLIETKQSEIPEDFLVGASCHNLDQLNFAERLGLDYCVISPVRNSKSHQNSKALGWESFSKLARKSCIPVYALGGVRPDDLNIARNSGAHGIAMISGLWETKDPETSIRALRNR